MAAISSLHLWGLVLASSFLQDAWLRRSTFAGASHLGNYRDFSRVEMTFLLRFMLHLIDPKVILDS